MKNTQYTIKLAALLLLSAVVASGCGTTNTAATSGTSNSSGTAGATNASGTSGAAAVELASLQADELVAYDEYDDDVSWSAESSTQIALNGSSAAVSGAGASLNGSTVTISAAGTYVLSGKLSGSVVVDAGKDDLVHLVLNGAEISNASGPAIHSKQADKTVLTLAEGTENSLIDGASYANAEEEDAPTAALFSQDDLTINGTGKLTITASYKDGITSKDDLKIVGGTLAITAADDGIAGRDLAAFKGGDIAVEAGGDGVKTTNTAADKGYLVIQDGAFRIHAVNDGLQAENSLLITGGSFDIVTGGGSTKAEKKQESDLMQRGGFGRSRDASAQSSTAATATAEAAENADTASEESESDSAKGLKAGVDLYIQAGTFKLDTKDDAVHSNTNIGISGGELSIAAGDDAIHADQAVLITGGSIKITASVEGIEGADIQIAGGEINLAASDDGINATEGSESETMTVPSGDMPQDPPADMPQAQGQQPDAPGAAGTAAQQGAEQQVTEQQAAGEQATEQQAAGEQATEQQAAGQQAGGMRGPGGMGGGGFGAAGNAKLTISGGTITVNAGGDGLDANGSITMSGGTVIVNGPTSSGNGSLDYDGTFEISGGTLIAAGSAGMAQAPSESSAQASVMMTFPSTLEAGTLVTLKDSTGNALVSYAPVKAFQTITISTPELKAADTYSFSTGDTEVVSFTLGESVTYVNESGVTTGGGGFGGGVGQGRGQMPGQGQWQGRPGQSGTTEASEEGVQG